jgi:tyrosine-protein phosphatase YwqE
MLCFPGNYLLMEISMYQEPLDLFEVLFELQNKGYKPILAHPERYPFYWNRTDVYRLLKRAGCLLQVNLFSFAGYYGKEVKAAAEWLHKNLFVDLVATDIHRAKQLELFEDKAVQHLLATADVKNNQFL